MEQKGFNDVTQIFRVFLRVTLDRHRKKDELLVVLNTHHYIFDLEIPDNEIWRIVFRNRIHNVILVFSRAVSWPVFVTMVLMGETRAIIYIPFDRK